MASVNELNHYWGGDLGAGASGDLQQASGTTRSQQRILRRLLTNPGDYVFHPDYGAGLPAHVGSTADVDEITALIRGQMLLEDAVSQSPRPTVSVQQIAGGLSVQISYTEAPSGAPVTLSFNVSQ